MQHAHHHAEQVCRVVPEVRPRRTAIHEVVRRSGMPRGRVRDAGGAAACQFSTAPSGGNVRQHSAPLLHLPWELHAELRPGAQLLVPPGRIL